MDLSKKIWQWLTLIFLAAIWGTSFILMKKGLQSFDHTQVAGFRIFISFLVLLPFSIKFIKQLKKSNIGFIIAAGVVGNLIPAYLFAGAQTQIASALAGMLNSLTPLFTFIIGILLFKAKTKPLNVVGIFIGLLGASGLIFQDAAHMFTGNNWFALLIALATLCYSLNVNIIKAKLGNLSGLAITSLSFLFVGPMAGISLLFTDFSKVTETPDYVLNFIYIAILAIVGSAFALVIMNTLIRYSTAIFVSSVTYIIPIFAIIWGVADGETINLLDLIAIGIVLVGVYLVNYRKKEQLSKIENREA